MSEEERTALLEALAWALPFAREAIEQQLNDGGVFVELEELVAAEKLLEALQ